MKTTSATTITPEFCELMYAHYADQLLTCTDIRRRKFIEESQNFYQSLHASFVPFESVIAGINTINAIDQSQSTLLAIYKQVALYRAMKSKPEENQFNLTVVKNIIKVYSSNHVLIAYVRVPGI